MNKKINIIAMHLRTGGIEICIINLANALIKEGYNVTIYSVLKNNEFEKDAFNGNVNIITLTNYFSDGTDFNPSKFYKVLRRITSKIQLVKAIKQMKDSIVISTRNEYSTLLSKYGDKSLLRIAQLHHDYVGHGMEDDFKYRYKNIDYFVHLTDEVSNEIRYMIRPYNSYTKVVTIPNFIPAKEHVEEFVSFNNRKNIALAVGRLSCEKGFLRLLDIWKIVQDKKNADENYLLYIVGEGSERLTLEKKILTYDLQDSVKLLGLKDNSYVKNLMKECKVYCMTSFTEAFPMVLLEAMENGLPQIAYNVRVGPRNLIINNTTGYLIDEENSKEYAAKILELFENEVLFNTLSSAGQKRSCDFSEETVIAEWIKLFNGAL
jgi:glycosyltransferase involved in cell wall biosynthesis